MSGRSATCGMPGTKPSARPPRTSRIGYGTRKSGASVSSAAPAPRIASRTSESCAVKPTDSMLSVCERCRLDADELVELRIDDGAVRARAAVHDVASPIPRLDDVVAVAAEQRVLAGTADDQ